MSKVKFEKLSIMKKVQLKRTGLVFAKPKDLLKPFGFCCDANRQDPDTHYNMRIPPLVTSLTQIAPKSEEGPDLKFRLQDIGKPLSPTMRSGTHKVKSSTRRQRGMRCRGPLRWYIEEEIALARDIVASEKAAKCKSDKEKKLQALKAKKKQKHKKSAGSKIRKSSDNQEEDNDDSEKDAERAEE